MPEQRGDFTSIAARLEAIQKAIQEHTEAIAKYEQTETSERQRQGKVDAERVVRLPSEVTEYYQSETDEESIKNRRDRWRFGLECAGVVIALGLVLANLGTLWIVHGQLQTMHGQLTQMQDQYPLLKQSADAATNAANTASSSLQFSRDSFRSDERPYLMTPVGLSTTIENVAVGPHNGQAKMLLPIRNFGKTPAMQVLVHGRIAIGREQVAKLNPFTTPAIKDENPIIAPGSPPPTVPIYSAPLKAGKLTLGANDPAVVYGFVTYTDIFPAPKPQYTLVFCQALIANPDFPPDIKGVCASRNYIK